MVQCVENARKLVVAGKVLVDGQLIDKPGTLTGQTSLLTIKTAQRFVSRGGDKLEAGLQGLHIDPSGLVCADIGCSTGGFTDCLLQNGAKKVYSIDVGYGLLDWKLRQDNRVIVLERTNARYLTVEHIPEFIDLAVIDASFISLELLLPPLLHFFDGAVTILALVKPQFQLPRNKVGPGGIVDDSILHEEALGMVERFGFDLGLQCSGVIASPVRGMKGNQEFFMLLSGSSAAKNTGSHKLEQGDDNEVS